MGHLGVEECQTRLQAERILSGLTTTLDTSDKK